MDDRPIGVFDSGIGGKTILTATKKLLPSENFIYFGDSKNCPYGDKSDEELKTIVKRAAEFLIEKNVKLIIVACNTATTRMIGFLRESFPGLPFIGTEPAVKPACAKNNNSIFILGTSATIRSKRLNELIKKNIHPSQKIVTFPLVGLAEAIELKDETKINNCLEPLKRNFSKEELSSTDAVVLGCTHYPFVLRELKAYFPNADFIDSGPGVARQTKKVLEKNHLLASAKTPGSVEYYFSKPQE
ncbi:glutamate racemase [Candidatus Saccharibacteria bacterium]|nr:glutamate racemase [Candidatus Saccharibacteria bacterium]